MKSYFVFSLVLFVVAFSVAWSQPEFTVSIDKKVDQTYPANDLPRKNQQVVKLTGVRFAYPLLQKWIDDFNKEYPDIQVIIESRASADPSQYDILVEAYEQAEDVKKDRDHIYIARYAVLPIANSKSELAKLYADKGLNKELIVQLFFHNIYADKENQKEIKVPFTTYTRLQKAGAPTTFARYFGFQQKDVKGKSIAGADEHILKALLRDSTGLSYLPLSIIYNQETKKPVTGITVLPVDLNGNGKVNDDEKFYGDISAVIQRFENALPKDLNNVPIEYLHLSVDKKSTNVDAITFLKWVITNGQNDLHEFGFLNPEPGRLERDKLVFSSKRNK